MFLQTSLPNKDSLQNPQGRALDSKQRDEKGWKEDLWTEKHASLSFLLAHPDGRVTHWANSVHHSSRLLKGEINNSWFYSQLPELLHGLSRGRSHETNEYSAALWNPVHPLQVVPEMNLAHIGRHPGVTAPQRVGKETDKPTSLIKNLCHLWVLTCSIYNSDLNHSHGMLAWCMRSKPSTQCFPPHNSSLISHLSSSF